jgi:hypothetical protein
MVMDWLKHAKDLQQKEELRKNQHDDQARRTNAIAQAAEVNWIERVGNRIKEITQSGFGIHVRQKTNFLELALKGKVILQYKGPQQFEVIYHDVVGASMLILREPVTVHHHRMVQVRELDSFNVEEILKFVVLGMQEYCKLAKYSRIERNLQHVKAVHRIDEHI